MSSDSHRNSVMSDVTALPTRQDGAENRDKAFTVYLRAKPKFICFFR